MNPLSALNHEGMVAVEEAIGVGLSDLVTWDSFASQTRGNDRDIWSHFAGVRFD